MTGKQHSWAVYMLGAGLKSWISRCRRAAGAPCPAVRSRLARWRGVGMMLAIIAVSSTALRALPTEAVGANIIKLDTHFDTTGNLGRPGWSIMDRHDTASDGDQVDYPRLVDGGVDGGFFAIFTPQGPRTAQGDRAARDAALMRAVQIREMTARHSDAFRFVTTSAEARAAAAAGKRFVFMSMENSSPVEADLSLMSAFRQLGVVMMGVTHFKNNDLGDSATDRPEWHGLSPKGRDFIAEANRLGIMLDASHASDEVLRQTIRLSRAPVICSHSGARAVFDHPRNLSDDDIRLLAAHGSVIQITAFSDYMIANPPNAVRDGEMKPIIERLVRDQSMDKADRRSLITRMREIDGRHGHRRASFDDFMNHLLHAIEVAGVDHVGISGDLDGGGGVDGLDSVADYPRITAALAQQGFTQQDIAKIWGGNALRVLDEVQAIAEPGSTRPIPVIL